MLRYIMQLMITVLVIALPGPALSNTPSGPILQAIQNATLLAEGGDPLGAMQNMLDALESTGNDSPAIGPTPIDRAFVSLYAGSFAQRVPDYERALSLYVIAAENFRIVGTDAARITAIALDRAASMQMQLKRLAEAYDTLMSSRGIRDAAALPVDRDAIEALRLAGTVAQALGEPQRVIAEFQAAAAIALQAGTTDPSLIVAQAASQAAEIASWLGAYPLADFFADIVVGTSSLMTPDLWNRASPRDEQHSYVCNELSRVLRQMAGMRIDYADYGGAQFIFSNSMPKVTDPMACADTLNSQTSLYTNTLKARLFLRTGDPFSAHLRLRGYEEDSIDANLPSEERKTSDAIVRARQAEARLALGFPGEARQLLDKASADEGLLADLTGNHDRLLVIATSALTDGDIAGALDALAAADTMMKERAPLHWFPRGEISFRHALILLEIGKRKEALARRDLFEAELGELAATIRDASRALFATSPDQQNNGDETALNPLKAQTDEHTESPAFRELDRMRLLFDLSLAAHDGDAKATRLAFEQVAQTGMPGSVGLAGHAQRAYLLACLTDKGAGIECSLEIKRAFDYPSSVPYSCVDSCTWIDNEASELAVNADMLRRVPLISRFAEPVLAWLIRAADQSVGRTYPGAPKADAPSSPLAKLQGRWNGADTAFQAIQRMAEGSAAAAVGQIGSRLASGSGEVAELMRERHDIAGQIDALFRGGEAPTGEINRLSERLKALSEKLSQLRPDHAELFDPGTMSVEEISASLPKGSAFVMISSTESATYVFAVRDDRMDWHRAPISGTELEDRVLQLRASLDPETANRSAVPLTGSLASNKPAFNRRVAHEIYRDLLQPVAELLDGDELYVVINGPLSSLPLSVLVRAEPEGDDRDPSALRKTEWLARTHAITLLPSPSALRLAEIQRSRPKADLPFIGFGDPIFQPGNMSEAPFGRLAILPGTRTEIRQLATLLGTGDEGMFLGREATKAAIFDKDLSQARVLAFATHGLLAGQLSGIREPGLVFTHPRPGANAEESYLTASEAATLDINADWVLLSACNTAGPDGRPDSEGLSGLARAFLFAGARSVLVSYWPVRDDAAMMLTTEALGWHAKHRSASRAAALQHAMVTLLSREDHPDLAHPSAWAPFVLLGDG